MSAAVQNAWLDALGHHAVLLVTASPHAIFQHGLDAVRARVDAVIVLDETGPIRGTSIQWLDEHRAELGQRPMAPTPVDETVVEDDLLE